MSQILSIPNVYQDYLGRWFRTVCVATDLNTRKRVIVLKDLDTGEFCTEDYDKFSQKIEKEGRTVYRYEIAGQTHTSG